MKSKTRVLMGSVLTMALCASLITGATMALFTSESKVNIAVSSGKVEVVATVDAESAQTKQLGTEYQPGLTGTFAKAVTIDAEAGKVTLDRFIPGDGVKFDIHIQNNSTITVRYRTKAVCVSGFPFYDQLDIAFNGVRESWQTLEAGSGDETIAVTIELAEEATDCQDLSTEIVFTVEALQGNAATLGEQIEGREITERNNDMGLSLNMEWALRFEMEKAGIGIEDKTTLTMESLHQINGKLDLSGYEIGNVISEGNTSIDYGYNETAITNKLTAEERAKYDGFTVPFGISSLAYGLINVTELDLSDTGIRYIPSQFLLGNPSIEKITLPDTVISIGYTGTFEGKNHGWGENPFAWMKSLKTINIPSALKYLADYSFAESPKLELNIETIPALEESGRKIFRVVDCITNEWMPEGSKVTGNVAVFAEKNAKAILDDFIFEGTAVTGNAADIENNPLVYRSTFGNIAGITGTLTLDHVTITAWMFDAWSIDTLNINYDAVKVTGQAFAHNTQLKTVNITVSKSLTDEEKTAYLNALFFEYVPDAFTVHWNVAA